MADTNPALATTQQESLNFLRIIRNELMMQNGFSESANQDRKDLLVAEEQIKQQMIDDAAAKAKAEAEAAKDRAHAKRTETDKVVKDPCNLQQELHTPLLKLNCENLSTHTKHHFFYRQVNQVSLNT